MALLTKDSILQASDVRTKEVEIPEWGGSVLISTMSAERHAIYEELASGKGKHDALAYYAVNILVNEDGSPMFESVDEMKVLGRKSSKALFRILNAGIELNGVTEQDIEDTAKKSEPNRSEDT